ncbi:MAG: hypothetical protein A2868_02455 [Candidatus Levybacteria bacterium RIFCSPHIGHO2_01_FULL_40_15b]|nr:MAG: hypothetical protein A2868_02455 [Candidatus Levybacteria bacterium RIFCSPHIGHO2_01_FULL_40_15b]
MFSARNITILLIVILLIGGISFLSFKGLNTPIITPNPAPTESSDIVSIQSLPDSSTPETSEVRSPDGVMKLIMEKTTIAYNTTYSFSIEETTQGSAKNSILSKTVLAGTGMELSQNAWSPDNKYFFITEKSGNSINYLVFKADGEYFSENEQYISVVPLFVAKNTGHSLKDITGWDSETLLHVYTIKEDGSRGPSFWFEIPSKAIIQLASR